MPSLVDPYMSFPDAALPEWTGSPQGLTGQNKSAATAITTSTGFTTTGIPPVDALVIAVVVCDDVLAVDAIGTGAVTASNGATMTRVVSNQAQTAASGVCFAVFTHVVSTSWSSGVTFTFTPNATAAAKTISTTWYTPAWGTPSGTPVAGFPTANIASGTAFSGLNAASSNSYQADEGDLLFGALGIEGDDAFTGDADTTNGAWRNAVNFGTSGGSPTTNVHGFRNDKSVTADGDQAWNPTVVANRDLRAALLRFAHPAAA